MFSDPVYDCFYDATAKRLMSAEKLAFTSAIVRQKDNMLLTNKENMSPNDETQLNLHNRRISLLTRTDSSVSSSDCAEMLTNTETSSISTTESSENASTSQDSREEERLQRMRKKVNELWADFLDGLSETNEQIAEQKPAETERLNPHTLKRDISRCMSESQVYLDTMAGIWDYFIWDNPVSTLFCFCALIYLIYNEFEITVFLGLILLQLAINFLETQKNINIGLRFLPRRKVELPKLNFSGLQLIFEAARQGQMLITLCADCLEKLRALFMWKDPNVTLRFVFLVSFFFWLSLLTSMNTYIIVVGFLTVNKMFVMTRMYYRFPKTRFMFDIAFYFYRKTPIEAKKQTSIVGPKIHPPIVKKRTFPFINFNNASAGIRRDTEPAFIGTPDRSNSLSRLSFDSSRRNSLNLPITPRGDAQSSTDTSNIWINDDEQTESDSFIVLTKPCTMIDSVSLRKVTGFVTLTDQQLSFRAKNSKHATIASIDLPFTAISGVKKIKSQLNRLKFGSSKGVQVDLCSKRQLQFFGISKCDDFYTSLEELIRFANEADENEEHSDTNSM